MKKIIFAGIISCLAISCTKEKIEKRIAQGEDNLQSVAVSLHPTGVKPDDPSLIEKVGYYKASGRANMPMASYLDLSAKMPAVGDQGSQSSCVGWAVGYYCKTYQEVVEKGWNATENAYSPSWIYNQINGGKDQGSTMSDALDLLVDRGCDFKDNFPYSSSGYTTKPDAASMSNSVHYKSYYWKLLLKATWDVKSALTSSQVVIFSIPVHPDLDNLNATNPVYDDFSDTNRGNHAICIVGYDDSKQAFKFINSWGTNWGLSGYGWIAYSKISSINSAYVLLDKANSYDKEYLTGDFNGDKVADIFTANGSGWYVSWGGMSGLKKINTASEKIIDLKVGDFNVDGRSDIFYGNGTQWKVSYSGTGKWAVINTSGTTAANLKIGDFNGDKKSDVFYATGAEWKVSYGGTGKWTVINTSGTTVSTLALGDFNGDGKSDVFHANEGEWKVSYGGTGIWTVIATASENMADLALADLNGDKKSDVFYASGSEWKVSYSGINKWLIINTSGVITKDISLADFNGDGHDDVFHANSSLWEVSWSGTSRWTVL